MLGTVNSIESLEELAVDLRRRLAEVEAAIAEGRTGARRDLVGEPAAPAAEPSVQTDWLIDSIARASTSVALFDRSMVYLAHSDRWSIDHGFSPGSMVGRCHFEILPDLPDRWRLAHDRCLAGECLCLEEDVGRGNYRPAEHFRWSIHPWRTPGGQVGGAIISMARLAEMAHACEEERELSRTRARFLDNIGHELRTPISGVVGMGHLLLDSTLDADQRSFARSIVDNGHALSNLIDDLLFISRDGPSATAGGKGREFNLRIVVEEVAEAFAARAHRKGLEVVCDYAIGAEEWFRGDREMVRSILMPLVDNAVKFTGKGEVTLMARVVGRAEGVARVRLVVRDTGIGVDSSRKRMMFEPFEQADQRLARKQGGAGIGLSVARKLADEANARIDLVSVPGLGSEFSVEVDLPVVRSTSGPMPAGFRPLKGRSIALGAANDAARGVAKARLESWGAHVVDARDPVLFARLIDGEPGTPPISAAVIDRRLLAPTPCPGGPNPVEDALRRSKAPWIAVEAPPADPARASKPSTAGLGPIVHRPIRPDALFRKLGEVLTPRVDAANHQDDRLGPGLPGREEAHDPSAGRDLTLAGIRVLMAEDNATNQKVAGRMLELFGCEVEVVEDGKRVFARFAEGRFDVILMDVQMPEMDGYQATAEIRRLEALIGGHVPIIAMTAHAMKGDRERCLESGMDDYLSKPLTRPDLAAALRRWVRKPAPASTTPAPPPRPADRVEVQPRLDLDPLRLSRLAELTAGDEAFERDILECLVVDVSSGLDRLRELASGRPIESHSSEVANTLHGIVGACRTVGADRLAQLCRDLETIAREEPDLVPPGWIDLVSAQFDELKATIDRLIAKG